MGSLSAGLNIALQSLLTEEGAIQTTSNNIANVNTPGYARQRPDLAETPPVQMGISLLELASRSNISPVCATPFSIAREPGDAAARQAQCIPGLGAANSGVVQRNQRHGLQSSLTAFFSSVSQLSANRAI